MPAKYRCHPFPSPNFPAFAKLHTRVKIVLARLETKHRQTIYRLSDCAAKGQRLCNAMNVSGISKSRQLKALEGGLFENTALDKERT
jgi:hypothetical protein